jgi:dihydrodipicolinate synthase/N-acetylneuraminate lyase
MDTQAITPQRLASSVIAVPPLARDANGRASPAENEKLVKHIESGGVSILLYGGNALFYHLRPTEFASTLLMLEQIVAPNTLVVPSVGPSYGLMMDQAAILRTMNFPTAMVLPSTEINTQRGLCTGIRRFAEAFGRPIVLYLKHNRWLPVQDVKSMVDDGLISWIKYAVVLPDAANDPYLAELSQVVPSELMVSGMGEQPAICHMTKFKMQGFTSGCVCIAPKWSARMLESLKRGDLESAERIRLKFNVLEYLRDNINPIRVLHHAVGAAGICDLGEISPLMSPLDESDANKVQSAAQELLAWERE